MVCSDSLGFAIPEPSAHGPRCIHSSQSSGVYDCPEVHFYSHGARRSIPRDVIMRQVDQSHRRLLINCGEPQGFFIFYQLMQSSPQVEGEISLWGIDPLKSMRLFISAQHCPVLQPPTSSYPINTHLFNLWKLTDDILPEFNERLVPHSLLHVTSTHFEALNDDALELCIFSISKRVSLMVPIHYPWKHFPPSMIPRKR